MSNQENYFHLSIAREGHIGKKKFPPRPQQSVDRGGRAVFAPKLSEKLDDIVNDFQEKESIRGIDPNLVFRIPLNEKASPKVVGESLEALGVFVVSMEPDRAIVVFKNDANLSKFMDAINIYQRGPKPGKSQTQYDFFELIEVEGMRLWERADRIGKMLADEIGVNGERIDQTKIYTVDIELWHPGNRIRCNEIIDNFRKAISEFEHIHDRYIGDYLFLLKASVLGSTLDMFLNIDKIAEIDFPPIANFDSTIVSHMTKDDIVKPAKPPKDGPRVCIIDSGITSNHPLLENHIGDAISVLNRSDSSGDMHGHGTMVGGIALFGDVRELYESGIFTSSITLYSARVLNEFNRFDDENLMINQLDKAIKYFSQPPYRCKVFNISIGGDTPAIGLERNRQNLYAECIDTLAHQYKVLIVVSAGNHDEYMKNPEELLTSYINSLFTPEARLCDYATSALAVTVGAIAQYSSVSIRHVPYINDLYKLIASPNEPSPMTRIGPGIRSSIKPDFVHYGGSPIFEKSMPGNIRHNDGTSIMSLSNKPFDSNMFAFNNGTSFAAPRVARLAALIEDSLKREFDVDASPSLLRAFLAASSSIPQEAESLPIENVSDIYGYGIPDENMAIFSSGSRVNLFAQDSIKPNNFHIYKIPIPDVFQSSKGKRTISVCLAFDPPVRRRRFDYFGVEINVTIVRGLSLTKILEKLDKQVIDASNESNKKKDPIPPVNRLKFLGHARRRQKSTLQKCVVTFSRDISRYGDEYFLLIRADNKWLRDEDVDYAVVITLESSSDELYTKVKQRLTQHVRVRV